MQKYVQIFGTATEILCQLKYCVFFNIIFLHKIFFISISHSLQRRRQTNREKNGFHNNPMILLFSHCTPILCINVPIPMQYMPIHIHTITEVSYFFCMVKKWGGKNSFVENRHSRSKRKIMFPFFNTMTFSFFSSFLSSFFSSVFNLKVFFIVGKF